MKRHVVPSRCTTPKRLLQTLAGLAAAALLVLSAPRAGAQLPMLHASGTNVVDANGNIVPLRGVNLGGWFIMEKWMSPLTSDSEPDTYTVMQTLDNRFGVSEEESLMKTYQQSWITTQDLDNIAAMGFNVIRVPVWYGQFYYLNNISNSGWRPDAFNELDWVVQQAAQRGIYTIIDMHGVVGGQSTSDDTGYANQNQYWSNSNDQGNTNWMWWQIANHYNGNSDVAGYDIMNEPTGAPNNSAVISAYNSIYNSIRGVDPSHMVIMEGTWGNWNWSMLPSPSTEGWTNVMYEMHVYCWNCSASQVESSSDSAVTDFHNHAYYNVPGYIGEFNDFGNGSSVWQYSVNDYNNAPMSWTPWAYKATHGLNPDSWGLYDPTWWPTTPNIGSDSSATIAADWQQWTTANAFAQNTSLGISGGVNNGGGGGGGSTSSVMIDAGGAASGSWAADEDYSGGNTASTSATIDTSLVANPAPQTVYQTERWGASTYTIGGLTAGANYNVNLHFAEIYWTSTGQREFNVSINGSQVLTNFDIVAAAGGADKAIVKSFSTAANSSGQIVIQLTVGAVDQPKISGIDIEAASSASSGGATSISNSAWYEVINKTSGLCMDAAGWGTANGTVLQQWTCGSQQNNQEWQFQAAASSGYDAVANRNAPALVWDDSNGSTANGNKIQLWTYGSGNSNQEWQPVYLGNSLWEFVNETSGLCLDNTGSTSTGVQMTQWSCQSGNTNQEFTLLQQP